MTTNPFFQKSYELESDFFHERVIESIQVQGFDMEYLVRDHQNFNVILGEDPVSKFDTHFTIEMSVKSFDQFEGEGTLFSFNGTEFRDQIVLEVSRRRFEEESVSIPQLADYKQPREGDLIFIPLPRANASRGLLFEVTKVSDSTHQFHAMQTHFIYTLTCDLYQWDEAEIETTHDDIEAIIDATQQEHMLSLTNITGTFLPEEMVYIGDTLVTSSMSALVASVNAPVLNVYDVRGETKGIAGVTLTGDTSGATGEIIDLLIDNRFQNENFDEQSEDFIVPDFDPFRDS